MINLIKKQSAFQWPITHYFRGYFCLKTTLLEDNLVNLKSIKYPTNITIFAHNKSAKGLHTKEAKPGTLGYIESTKATE